MSTPTEPRTGAPPEADTEDSLAESDTLLVPATAVPRRTSGGDEDTDPAGVPAPAAPAPGAPNGDRR